MPGIDLTPHIGEVVVVRHDTGPTLLASQLELPNQPLYPMVGERGAGRFNDGPSYTRPRRSPYGGGIEQAAYVDNDDASVQLLPEEMPLPGHSSHAGGHVAPLPMMNAGAPGYPDQMMMPGPGGPGCNSQYCDPVYVDPYGMQPYPGQMMSPYPQYGGNPISYQYGQQAACNTVQHPHRTPKGTSFGRRRVLVPAATHHLGNPSENSRKRTSFRHASSSKPATAATWMSARATGITAGMSIC